MAHMNKRVAVTLKLPQLQNLIKRDPASYKDEFTMQKRHFESELEIFKLRPTKESERFTELVTFMSHVAVCYKEECENLAPSVMELLETHANILHTDVRAKLLQACIMLRNKGMIDPLNLIRLAFKLFSVNDKTLRSSLVEYVFNDIKTINQQKQNDKLNRSIQAFLFSIVEDDTTITARKTVEILCELYRRKVWTDARTVNMLGKACLSQSTRVCVAAINFFLGIETKMHEDEEEEKTVEKGPQEVDYHAHSKKTKKRQRQTQKQIERNAKQRRDNQKDNTVAQPLFPAIQMLHDPQTLAEKLFKKIRQSGERFEVKLLMMNFTSRLIGCHKLLLLSFYSYLQRYLTSHQQDVTQILAYLIQACHELVPPEDLVPIVKAIAHNFITERCTNEAITVGINAVREIIVRAPSLLREPGMDDFVQDLVMYGKKAHKSVMIAAHGMVNLVR
jgi:protein SDA1